MAWPKPRLPSATGGRDARRADGEAHGERPSHVRPLARGRLVLSRRRKLRGVPPEVNRTLPHICAGTLPQVRHPRRQLLRAMVRRYQCRAASLGPISCAQSTARDCSRAFRSTADGTHGACLRNRPAPRSQQRPKKAVSSPCLDSRGPSVWRAGGRQAGRPRAATGAVCPLALHAPRTGPAGRASSAHRLGFAAAF